MTEQSLIDTIEGKFVPTPAVLLGAGVRAGARTPELFAVPGGYRCGDYSFAADVMAPALA